MLIDSRAKMILKLIYGSVFLLVITFSSCTTPKREGGEVDSTSAVSDITSEHPQDPVVPSPEVAKGRFLFEVTPMDPNDEYGMPKSRIFFEVDRQLTRISQISGEADEIDRKNFQEMEIPMDAVDACGAWWGGSGSYIYAVRDGEGYQIFSGWVAEEQDTRGYHWKLIKKIK